MKDISKIGEMIKHHRKRVDCPGIPWQNWLVLEKQPYTTLNTAK